MISKPVAQRRLGRAFLLLLLGGLTALATAFFAPAAPSSASSSAAAGSVGAASATAPAAASFFASMTGASARRRPRLAPLRVVWSNPQETDDYFRRIEGKEEKDKVCCGSRGGQA